MCDVLWITPEMPEYETERKNWDAQFNIYPDLIAKCFTMKGVQKALEYIVDTKQKFAVRASRHCFEPWSLSPGVVLDVGNLNYVKVGRRNGIPAAKIGSGGQLGDIYNSLLKHGYFIPAGTRPTVGIGGQGLNGGIGGGSSIPRGH